ncbi:MAG: extracellular solute-binding protein [Hyphomicrobiales bacterium]|nr:extracellular solute-binding protein [Hyphomicrobiales bacterium]
MRAPLQRRLQLVCLLLVTNGLPAASSQAADEALIDAARKEGQVVWYTTQIINQFARPAAEAFQKKYGIKVNFLRGDSVETAVRILNEGRSGKVRADVFDGTSTLPAVKRQGLVLKWLPDAAMRLPAEYRDPEGYWVATNLFVHTPVYNTTLIPKHDSPRSFDALLEPRFAGRMAWASHATTSGAPGFIGLVLDEMGHEKGRDYLRRLSKQKIISLGGSARAAVDQVIAGEYAMVLQAFNHQPVISARRGAPVDWSRMNPGMGVLSVAAVLKDSPNPNAGKLLLDFLLSPEGQMLFRSGDYIPVDPRIEPREPGLRPDGSAFRARFYSPEYIDKAMPEWHRMFKEMF